jgi:hypothetical protein
VRSVTYFLHTNVRDATAYLQPLHHVTALDGKRSEAALGSYAQLELPLVTWAGVATVLHKPQEQR